MIIIFFDITVSSCSSQWLSDSEKKENMSILCCCLISVCVCVRAGAVQTDLEENPRKQIQDQLRAA